MKILAYDSGSYQRELHPVSCSVSRNLQPLSTANMTLLESESISALDWVEITTPDGITEYYRVASVSTSMETGQKSVYLEHGACTLGDTLITGSSTTIKNTVENVLGRILQDNDYWSVGTVECTQTIYADLGDNTPLDAISTIMENIPQYYARFYQQTDAIWRVDILQRPTTAVCEARLSRNLESCDISYDANDICTRVYADGLSGGYQDSSRINQYGVHEKTMSLNDGLDQSQKTAIVTAYLNAHDTPAVSVSISAVELSQITGLSEDKFVVGTVCKVVIPWLNVTKTEVITQKTYSDCYGAPQRVTLTLANPVPDLSIAVAQASRGAAGTAREQAKQNKRFETHFEQTDEYFRLIATDTEWDELGHGTVTAYGQIVLNSNSFQALVQAVGQDGEVTAASITLAINAEGSNAIIDADHVRIEGNTVFTDDVDLQAALTGTRGDFLDLISGQMTADIIYAHTLQATRSSNNTGGSVTGSLIYATDQLSIGSSSQGGSGSLYFQGTQASWQSMSVVTSVGVTLPSITFTSGKYDFVYENGAGVQHTMNLYGVSGHTSGSVSPSTTTIYYLGHT